MTTPDTAPPGGAPDRGSADEAAVALVARFQARDGAAEVLRARLQEMVRLTNMEPGCLRYELHEDELDDHHLVILETWADPRSLDEHMQTTHVKALVTDVPRLAANDIQILRLRRL